MHRLFLFKKMAYTHINTYGSAFKRMKAQSIMGIPAGPDLPTPDTEDGFCLFIQTDSSFANGKLKMWDGADWTDISDPDRYGETTSSVADVYEVIFDPELLAYNKGDVLKVKFNATNAGPATLAPNALPARTIVLPGGSALSGGEIISDGVYLLFVNDTNLQLLSGGGTSIPDLTGNENKVLSNDGENLLWKEMSNEPRTYTNDPATSSTAIIPDFEGIHLYNINPENTVATLSRKLPENPENWDSVTLKFGGDITSGAVVTAFTLTADQDVLLNPAASAIEAKAGDVYEFVFYGGVWYGMRGESGGGGSSEWGNITGDIDDQTDLKNELDYLQNQINAISPVGNKLFLFYNFK